MPNISPFLVPDRIESPRLVLRTFRPDDWPFLHEHYSDPESTRFTFRRALSEGDSWYAMANMVGHWHLRGYGPYAVEEKTTGNVLGTVGYSNQRTGPNPKSNWR